MYRILDNRTVFALAACLLLAVTGVGQAQAVVAVLSSDLEPYAQAFEGFQEMMGVPVARYLLPSGVPDIRRETRVVMAFGGKAALRDYPEGVSIVSCLAPGLRGEPGTSGRRAVSVHMHPPMRVVLTRLREIQPGLNRLAVFWVSETMEEDAREMQREASGFGIEVLPERGRGTDDLPDRLRSLLQRRADGLWLPPDPLLITPRNFSVLREFCWANDIPLYVPTAGLVEKGAVASVSCSFRDMGRAAGRVVRHLVSGGQEPNAIYPEEFETVVNATAAASTGLRIPPEVLSRMSRVLP